MNERPEAVLAQWRESLREARESELGLDLVGGNTKRHLRPVVSLRPMRLGDFRGIVEYVPAELVVVARAGTRLAELEAELAQHGQQLAFEPPRTGEASTLGGVVSAGFSGPSRPWTAALRDHVLGVTLMDANGELLRFGGKVMKNVAGYDVPRLVCGAWGQLGPIAEISFRVVPGPACQAWFAWPCGFDEARQWLRKLPLRPLPLTGLCFHDGILRVRFAGASAAVRAAAAVLPACAQPEDEAFWVALRDWRLPLFNGARRLWRIDVPSHAEPLKLSGEWLWDWGGALRWLATEENPARVRAFARSAGGHARTLDSGYCDATDITPVQRALEARVRRVFDPAGRFSMGTDARGD